MLTEQQLERYSRQLMLSEWGANAQERLLNARVLVIGAGGLGCPIALYLCASGVGSITLVDDDKVELSNLQRQILHPQAMIGKKKVESAVHALQALNSEIQIIGYGERLEAHNIDEIITGHHIVIDGSDNFATRLLVHRTCWKKHIPLLYAAIRGWHGYITMFDRSIPTACLECFQPEDSMAEDRVCSHSGVMGPICGLLGSVAALEVIQYLGGVNMKMKGLRGYLWRHDGLEQISNKSQLIADPDCHFCVNQ
jgi:molybdopterin/thiamine biosynthesis adenylyltransferase